MAATLGVTPNVLQTRSNVANPAPSAPQEQTSESSSPRPPASLLSGPAVARMPQGMALPACAGPSPWWSQPGSEHTVSMNGHAFDLEPTYVAGEYEKGSIDGPLDYNGTYRVTVNRAASATGAAGLRLVMEIAGDSFEEVDLRAVIDVRSTDTGPVASIRIENRLVPESDPIRSQVRQVPLVVSGSTCSFKTSLLDPNGGSRSLHVEWQRR